MVLDLRYCYVMARRIVNYGIFFFATGDDGVWHRLVSEKLRTTIYLRKTLRLKVTIMTEALESDDNLTAFTEQMIREKWEKCVTPQMEAEFTRRIKLIQRQTAGLESGASALKTPHIPHAKGTSRKSRAPERASN